MICTTCNGSGEGQHDGTVCPVCKGSGSNASINTQAVWSISLDTTCPHCNEEINLTYDADFLEGLEPLECYKGLCTLCPECCHEFIVDCEY
jgi:RecJ-like exonuclease